MAYSTTNTSPSARRSIHRGKAATALRGYSAKIKDRSLPKSARLLAMEFMALCDKRTGMCHPSIARLAVALAVDEKTIRRSIAALVAHGFLIVIKRGGHLTDQYRLQLDTLAALADTITDQVAKVCNAAAAAAKAARASAIAKGLDIIKATREAARAARKAARAARDAIQGKATPAETATPRPIPDRTFCPRILSKNINILSRETGNFASKSGFWKTPGTPQGQVLSDQKLDNAAYGRLMAAAQAILGRDLFQRMQITLMERPDAEELQAQAIKAERYRPGTGLDMLKATLIGGATA